MPMRGSPKVGGCTRSLLSICRRRPRRSWRRRSRVRRGRRCTDPRGEIFPRTKVLLPHAEDQSNPTFSRLRAKVARSAGRGGRAKRAADEARKSVRKGKRVSVGEENSGGRRNKE